MAAPSGRKVTVTLTQTQVLALLLAVDEHRQNQIENGMDVRALDNATTALHTAYSEARWGTKETSR